MTQGSAMSISRLFKTHLRTPPDRAAVTRVLARKSPPRRPVKVRYMTMLSVASEMTARHIQIASAASQIIAVFSLAVRRINLMQTILDHYRVDM